MELPSLLQQIRSELNLTQAEMVEQLSVFNTSFKYLDLITYSRWERGVSIPSTVRIIYLLEFAQYDILNYLINLNLKLSETKKGKLKKLEELQYDQETLVETAYYPIEEPNFIRYSALQPLNNTKQLKKINAATSRFFNLPDSNLATIVKIAIKLQQKNRLHILTCEDEEQHLCAHALYSIHDLSERPRLIQDVKTFYQFPRSELGEQEQFIFLYSFIRFTFEWWAFNFYTLIDIICKNPQIKEIFCVVINKHSGKLFQNLGFSIIEKINVDNKFTSSGQRKLMSITREDFLSHHGVISWIKKHQSFIQ